MKIRKAVFSDAAGIAKVHVDSWISTYSGIIPTESLDKLTYESRQKLWEKNILELDVFVAENIEGRIIGFSAGRTERITKHKGFDGELSSIYLLKEYQGKGIGKKLLYSVVNKLRSKGINSMLVLVLEDNPSRYFYEAMGAVMLDTIELEIGEKKLNEIVYGWDEISKLA